MSVAAFIDPRVPVPRPSRESCASDVSRRLTSGSVMTDADCGATVVAADDDAQPNCAAMRAQIDNAGTMRMDGAME